MSDKTDLLLDRLAESAEEIDGLVEDREQEANDLTFRLLTTIEDRDPEVFDLFEADPTLTLADFHQVAVLDRDMQWSFAFASMISAVRMQVFSEVFGVELLSVIERENEGIRNLSASMSQTELGEAAKKGISKERFSNAKEKRQQRKTEKTEA